MALILDQLGLNARSMEDIIALDGLLCGTVNEMLGVVMRKKLRSGVERFFKQWWPPSYTGCKSASHPIYGYNLLY